MKKLLLILMFSLVFGVASCKKSNSSNSNQTENEQNVINQEEVDNLKELLNKQDLSEFTSKGFATMFTQEYNVLDLYKDSEEDEKTASYFNYISLGFLDLYYDLTEEQYDKIVDDSGEINIFDAISAGEGGYRITQTAKTASFFRDGGKKSDTKNLDISQQMTLKADDENVSVYNILDVTDNQIFDYASRQEFAGSINKDLLFGSLSTGKFCEIFSQVNLFDSPGNVENLDRLYFSICKDLKTKSNEEIYDFIIDNEISIEEVDDKYELSFVFKENNYDEKYIDTIFPGTIKGTLTYNKETGSFEEFSYEIKYVEETYDEESGSLKTVSMIFTCSGRTARGQMGDMWLPDDLTIYDNVTDFLEKVSEEVIPPII
jgi:hypothetical protein